MARPRLRQPRRTSDTVGTNWLPAALVILLVVVRHHLDADPALARRARAVRDRLEPHRRLPRRRQRLRARGSAPTRSAARSPRSAGSRSPPPPGLGDPNAGDNYTLISVAAAVLGGVSLLGGVGGLIGPIAAAFVLRLVHDDPGAQGRGPGLGEGDPGRADRGRDDDRRPRAPPEGEDGRMTRRARTTPERRRAPASRRLSRDNPALILIFVYVGLFVVDGHRQPGAERARLPHAERAVDDFLYRGDPRAVRRGADARHADRRRRPLGGDDGHGRRVHGLALRRARRARPRSRSRSSSAWSSGSSTGSASRSSA